MKDHDNILDPGIRNAHRGQPSIELIHDHHDILD